MSDVTKVSPWLDAANLLPDAEFMAQIREILDRSRPGTTHSRGPLKEVGATNKIKDKLGERNAIAIIKRKYPGAGVLEVATRGAHGAPVLDGLLETDDGRFVVVEAKWSDKGKPTLGAINSRRWINEGSGWKEVKLERAVRQMSPDWVEAKILELKRIGGSKYRRLAFRLEQAFREGRVLPYLVTTDDVGEVRKITNLLETAEWEEYRELAAAAEKSSPRATESAANAKSRAVANRGTGPSARPPRARPEGQRPASFRPGEPSPSRATPKDLDIRTRGSRLADASKRLGKLRLSFGPSLIVELATAVLLGKLESELGKVNDAGLSRGYWNQVYKPVLRKIVDETVDQVRSGTLERMEPKAKTHWIYAVYEYDVLMERQAETVSDAVVSILRGFEFVEVFHSVKSHGELRSTMSPAPIKGVSRVEKRREIREDVFRYRHEHKLLVWDPEAARTYRALRRARTRATARVDSTMSKIQARAVLDPPTLTAVVLNWTALLKRVKAYEFLSASKLLTDRAHRPSSLPRLPGHSKRDVEALARALRVEDRILDEPDGWRRDRKTVLKLYLGTDPFAERNRLHSEERARERAARRAREEQERERRSGKRERAEASYTIDPSTGRETSNRKFK